MALSQGTRLGPYEVVSPLGAGGMGEVYKARDTRLERTVAIKVLNTQLVASPDLRARFEREAKVVSQLQHPHICVLHDVGSENGTDYLVMEFLEGESLADRLRRGPLSTPELLKIAIATADALEKAHRAGVVHRDLKPGNVMLTKTGAKLLDFGLAKPLAATATARTGAATSGSVFAAALTQTSPVPSPASPLSAAGSVLGTVQYMSPEQIQGMEADARSDIFAFGVMLFEMATGKRAFEGKTQASVVGQILAVDPPPVSKLQPATPPELERLIRLCLEKDPDERIQSAHDLKLQFQAIAEAPESATQAPASAPTRRSWLPWAAVALLLVAVLALGWAYVQSQRAPAASVHAYLLAPEKTTLVLAGTGGGFPIVSPDGLRLAFIATGADGKQMLWVQPLNSTVAQPLAGTENATYPFWSADSRYIAFFANSKLNKVDANGGPPQEICPSSNGRGGAWNLDGTIVFAPNTTSGLLRVEASGGTPVPLTSLATGESSHRWPQFLPDGKHFLYFSHANVTAEGSVYVGTLDSKQSTLLLHNDSGATYAAGYLLFVRDNTLMAQAFDARRLTLEGDAHPLMDHVGVNSDVWSPIVSASQNGGVLVYQRGSAGGGSQLVWFDRAGKQLQPLFSETAEYGLPALSPEGNRLALRITSNGLNDIWVADLVRNTKTRITFGPGGSSYPVWWPDGKSLVYGAGPMGIPAVLYRKNADGTGEAEKLLDGGDASQLPFCVSSDGRYIVYMRRDSQSRTDWDIWALPTFGDKKPFPVVQTEFPDTAPALSPDGKWLAYSNTETGRAEVYIRPFPSGPGKWQVSTTGGGRAVWRKDGGELYFVQDKQLMAVDVSESGGSVRLGTPHLLFKAPMVVNSVGPYAAAGDGKKFLINQSVVQASTEPLTLITNWTADLKK